MVDTLSSPLAITLLCSGALVIALGAYATIGKVVTSQSDFDDDLVRRVARNSVVPIASQLLIRGMDLAAAIVLLRLLGPEGNGRYALAVVVWLYVKTVSDFGLNLLATGDIARDPTTAGRVVGETTLLRLIVLAISGVPTGFYVLAGTIQGSLATESALAIGVLYLSIIPASFAEAVNAALNGLERMVVGAWLNIAVSLVRAPLVVVLAIWLGVEGVALAALITAALSADLYRRAADRAGVGRIVWSLGLERSRWLAARSGPLLVNALLINLFFRVDVFIVQATKGDAALGVYDAAYKFVNLVTIVPAYITLAVFPALAQRSGDPAAVERVLRTTAYLMVWIAWSIVTGVSALAGSLIRVLAGADYLPEAAHLLRILIWFAPLSFLNGVIQYALIAVEEQRRVVPAFVAAVVANLALNLALVPVYGTRAAAGATVATELVILIAFGLLTRSTLVPAVTRSALARLWRPTAVGLICAGLALGLADRYGEAIAIVVAAPLFIILSVALGVIGASELALVRRAVRRRPARG